MADLKISQLTAATTPLAGTETLPIVQSGTTKQVSVANLTAGRAVSASSLSLTSALTVANGGTGLATLTANRIPYGNGTSALQSSANLTFDGTTLTTSGNIVCTGGGAISAANSTGGSGGLRLQGTSNNTNAKIATFFGWNGTETGSIETYVNVTTYNTSSDQRLKNDIGVATDMSVIDNTIIHDFSWKYDGRVDRGVFAQEARLVKPIAVMVGEDRLTESGDIAVPWAVDYSKYIPDIIVYCQQLKKMVTSQQDEIDALKQAVAALTAKVGG
jgi:hypothetical protein